MFNPFSDATEDILVEDFTDEYLIKFRQQVQKKSLIDPVQPLIINICSSGGSADVLAAMIATLESVPNKIITVAVGKAFSCGAILLAAGDYRFIDKNSRVMIHEVSGGLFGDIHAIKAGAKEMARLNEYWLGHFAKNCGLSNYQELRKRLKEQDNNELWFYAKEAKEFGIVDFVGLPQVRPFVIFDIGCVSYPRTPGVDSKEADLLAAIDPKKKKVTKKKANKKTKKKSKKKTVKSMNTEPMALPDPFKTFTENLPQDLIRVYPGVD